MKADKEFDNILNECLERLLVDGETIEQCLQRYPKQAPELEPLLQTALEAKQASAIQPRAEFKAKARYQFSSALKDTAPSEGRPFFGWLPRWAMAVTIILILLLAGGGTLVAASNSMPDSPLYSLKLAAEEAHLMLTPSKIGKARLCAELVDRRVEEIIYMADKGDAHELELSIQRLDERLDELAVLVSALGGGGEAMLLAPEEEAAPEETLDNGVRVQSDEWLEFRMSMAERASENRAVLLALLKDAPDSLKPALRRAIAVSVDGYQKAIEALD